jgi:hypothetical protein
VPESVVELDVTMALGLAKMIDAEVGHDPIQPGVEARVALELPDVSVDLDETLLHHVEGVLLVAEESIGDRIDFALIALHQDFEGPFVAGLGGRDEGEVLGVCGDHVCRCLETGARGRYSAAGWRGSRSGKLYRRSRAGLLVEKRETFALCAG